MGILTRYLIRSHAGPFFFALAALTGLLFLNAIAQRLQDLAGKGLTWDVVLEFMKLSLPHTLALTLPMAVLVSVLYAFSDLAANHEITAMKAGGVRPQRLLVPMLIMGALTALVMFLFNDRVLPESNHGLKNLMLDINRKSPTLTLREQVVNQIPLTESGQRVFLYAGQIDNIQSTLYDVVIIDPNDPLRYRTTTADSGSMAFNEARTDLYLTLFHGVVYESTNDPPGEFRQVYFDKQIVPLRGIGNEMERRVTSDRSDREMTIAMLAAVVRERDEQAERVRSENLERSRNAVRFALGYPVDDLDVFGALPGTTAPRPSSTLALVGFSSGASLQTPPLEPDHAIRRLSTTTRASETQLLSHRLNAARFRVEIHKKYSLSIACLVFVLVGAPIAVRFPQGGLGMVIAVSSSIFAVYWMGLIGGENLADRGVAPPALGMWFPNVVFAVLGLLLVRGMGREAASMRGGGLDELLFSLRERIVRVFRGARARRPSAGATEA